jgi:hypothetical protein
MSTSVERKYFNESVVNLTYVIILLWSLPYIVRSFAYICISLITRGEMQWNKRGSDVMSEWTTRQSVLWLETRLWNCKDVAIRAVRDVWSIPEGLHAVYQPISSSPHPCSSFEWIVNASV